MMSEGIKSILDGIVEKTIGLRPESTPSVVGNSGTMYKVNGCFVRLVLSDDPDDYRLDLPYRESHALGVVRRCTDVPVASVLGEGRDERMAYTVLSQLQGKNALEDPPSDLRRFGQHAGQKLAQIHRISGDGCGYVDRQGFAYGGTWFELVSSRYFNALIGLNGSIDTILRMALQDSVRYVP